MQERIRCYMKEHLVSVVAIVVWIVVWKCISLSDAKGIFIAAPEDVFVTLVRLTLTKPFWGTIVLSSLRILAGFLLALLSGIVLAAAAYYSKLFEELISPLIKVIKAVPVASFIILALLWIASKDYLSTLISFLMVLPMIYSNVLQGLRKADAQLLEMASVFKISKRRKIAAIYIPSVYPFFVSAVSVGMGFSWKAGIAAEVIGIPSGSIGERLYEAKLYIMTKELFAWTIVIIIVSVCFEKAVIILLRNI